MQSRVNSCLNSPSLTTAGPSRPAGLRPGCGHLRRRGSSSAPARGSTKAGWARSTHPSAYVVRGKFSRRRFETECLAEYAHTFPVVGGDFSFYQFPTDDYWHRLFGESPPSLRFGFKVPEEITVATWPGHARYGQRAGKSNESFLDVAHFERGFARPLEPYRDRVATMMFEFGTFPKSLFKTGAEFSARLDPFLAGLPGGFRYAVEIRNPEYLTPDYFAMLAAHNVAHVYNAWTRMPALADQVMLPGAFTADFTAVRLTAPGTQL